MIAGSPAAGRINEGWIDDTDLDGSISPSSYARLSSMSWTSWFRNCNAAAAIRPPIEGTLRETVRYALGKEHPAADIDGCERRKHARCEPSHA